MASNRRLLLLTFAIVSLFDTLLVTETSRSLIIWNVGQGQWATIRDEQRCWHLDMGGEFAPWRAIAETCRRRDNLVSLSHWDWDHISFAAKAQNVLPNICLLHRPPTEPSARKRRLLHRLSTCGVTSPFEEWLNPHHATSNDQSRVLLMSGVLAPGDSSTRAETTWASTLRNLEETRYLIVGHHGSRTSTGEHLLKRLSRLRLAIASARQRRFGHPHPEVLERLSRHHIPLLRTEDWGNIHIVLD